MDLYEIFNRKWSTRYTRVSSRNSPRSMVCVPSLNRFTWSPGLISSRILLRFGSAHKWAQNGRVDSNFNIASRSDIYIWGKWIIVRKCMQLLQRKFGRRLWFAPLKVSITELCLNKFDVHVESQSRTWDPSASVEISACASLHCSVHCIRFLKNLLPRE
jgi:hypothetical protein